MSFGIYVHIPFCARVCPYCDFNVYLNDEPIHERYLDAVLEEARSVWRDQPAAARSIFLGGGTPSLLDPALTKDFLSSLKEHFDVADDAEVTLETNPEDAHKLAEFHSAGINRVSLGVQSIDAETLANLGRMHTPDQARDAVRLAREAGFDNVSLDLIFGMESLDSWKRTLDAAVDTGADHVSAYSLTIEEGTAFGHAVKAGRMQPPDDDEQAEKYEVACDVLGSKYKHYEISNWGRPSVHNMLYWTQGEYAGLGAGAHSHRNGLRWWNVKNPRAYIERASNPRAGEERPDRADEWLMLRMRLVEGIDLTEASAVLGRDLGAFAQDLVTKGLAERAGDRLQLTRKGLLLENAVLALAYAEC